ncbi:LPXTG cell wall anchor domain-containing protein [Streptococcus agalactiae]|uniref:LPXTG cell wall anchor domain-containing protein n=1 Tax=Streptococcus agalactiae TaxID=1311 RepID=UPI0030EC8507
MMKKPLLATLLLSSALLSVSTLASADEVTTPTDPTTAPAVVTPTEPSQTVDTPTEPTPAPTPGAPVDTTSPVETPTEKPAPAPTDPTTTPPNDNTGGNTNPITPVEDNTTPTTPVNDDSTTSTSNVNGNSTDSSNSSADKPSTDSSKPEGGSDQPSKSNDKNPALPKDKKDDIVDNGDGTKTVKTDDGESVKLDTDKSKPTNNAKVTAEQAKKAGASQVGTTSKVTGQVVSNVTNSQPLTLASGFTITDIQDGVATLVDGTRRNLTELGATKNSDGTYSVKTVDGKSVTLPETGDELFISALVSLIGLGFVGGTSYFTFKKKA